MGSDNLFHKRKGTNKESLHRRAATRKPAPLYLIVCEGEKTEPYYFNELRNVERISSITIRVCGECNSAPISVVDHAAGLFNKLKSEGTEIEKVFCVFDRDNHESYHRACAEILKHSKNGVPITHIRSVPCFEYWLVLHFKYHRASYMQQGRSSVANMVAKDLKTHIKDYQKGITGLYSTLKERQPYAIENAKRALDDASQTGEDNPTTEVHILIEELLEHCPR